MLNWGFLVLAICKAIAEGLFKYNREMIYM